MPEIAVLIDAENVLPVFAEQIFAAAAAAGRVAVREIYGTAAALTSWVEPVLRYALHPNLTIRASKWKNTSDIALAIGAMDLLPGGKVDTVIIVSSDSDFSTLSVRLRSAGIQVIGMGTEKANPLWRTACSDFTVLQMPQAKPAAPQAKPAAPQAKAAVQPQAKAAVQPQAQAAAAQSKAAATQPKAAAAQPKAAAAQSKAPAAKAAATHAERTAIIRQYITRQLEASGGRMALSVLFQSLNGLPEYQVDQQGSKRKPTNYLTWLFGDVFRFEDSGNGGYWISLLSAQPAAAPEAPKAKKADAPEVRPAAPAAAAEASAAKPADRAEPSPAAEAAAVSPDAPSSAEAPAVPAAEASPAPETVTETAPEAAPLPAAEAPAERRGSAAARHSGRKAAPAEKAPAKKPKDEPPAGQDLSGISLHDIGLQPRPLASLLAAGYGTLADLAPLSDKQLLSIKNIGFVSVEQIRRALRDAGAGGSAEDLPF